jgi:hypothetical protein
VSSVVITLCVASQRVFIVVYFLIESVRKKLDTASYFITVLSTHLLTQNAEDQHIQK